MDLHYRVQPYGQLEASNQVILNQLTFGERVESPDATKLPVLLAVALLKDRHGVIDFNLPVSGSVADPQFSVGGIIVRVIVNLLVKAITAPFALLSGGATADLSQAEFKAGTAELTEAGKRVIDKVAAALVERPALSMTVTGASDPQSEREAMQAEALERQMVAELRRQRLGAGMTVEAVPPALTDAQRLALVRRLYRDGNLPGRPRNAFGLLQDLPIAEMENRLKAGHLVIADNARVLALQRGLAVRDALVLLGMPASRLFLGAPRLRASSEEDAAWSPRVQLSLSAP